jgi:hypothetical protein
MDGTLHESGLVELRRRYPWPEKRPDVPHILHAGRPDGWCSRENVDLFRAHLSEQSQVVVELGSWLGRSATFFAEAAPNAAIICIDHWKGSSEHHRRPDWKEKLPVLYDTFLTHLWEHRDRVVPMKTGTLDGMVELVLLEIAPDLVYVDASHETPFVYEDLMAVLEYFPDAFTCGDDWCHASVEKGVMQAVQRLGIEDRLRHGHVMWWLE